MSRPAATHRFLRQRIGEIDKVTMYRLSDGMKVAMAAAGMVVFGEDPNRPSTREFLSHSYAVSFLRGLADRDWAVQNDVRPEDIKNANYAAVIDEDYVDKKIIAPGDLVGSGRAS